jgi:hypothetical protein
MEWNNADVWTPERRGRKRPAESAMGPSVRDVAIGVCMALRRGEPVDPQTAHALVSIARDQGAVGTDIEVLMAACSTGLASMSLTASAARGGTAPSPTPSSPYALPYQQQQQGQSGYQQAPSFGGSRKRRADETLWQSPSAARSARDIAFDICRRTYRGEPVTQAEVEALREIARQEGSLGANLIRDVPGLCRAALVLMGESPASMAALAGGSMQGRRPGMPAAPPSSPVGPAAPYPRTVRLDLAPRATRYG